MRIKQKSFRNRIILAVSILVLFITTAYWATLGAIVHNNNADQLVDPLLFTNFSTFQQATFPAAHTFLIKWPVFALIAQFNNIPFATIIATVVLCLITVGGLFYVMYRIEKRPLVLALLALFLSSILLMIPVEPRPGALLPTNFAMLTTRNIEYLIFVTGILLVVKSDKRRLYWSMALLTLLFASDRLFMFIGLGASILALATYWLLRHKQLLSALKRMLIVVISAAVLNYCLLAIINVIGLTHISSDAGAPYQLNTNSKDQLQAGIYALLGAATNVGVNLLYDLNSWKEIGSIAMNRLSSWTSIAYIINGFGVAYIISVSLRLPTLPPKRKDKSQKADTKNEALFLSLLLCSSAISATILFVATIHYYPADARYLAIWLWAVAILAATTSLIYWKKPSIKPKLWILLSLSILCGIASTQNQFLASINAYSKPSEANDIVKTALDQHPVKTVVGDYWRVVPIVANTSKKIALVPLGTCFGSRTVLTSKAWTADATQNSFAYLLTTNPSVTGFPACKYQDVQNSYGVPSRKIVVKGELPYPEEMLLIYDHGLRPNNNNKPAKIVRNLEALGNTPCPTGTILQIVAHPDDDLLFMNPDLLKSLKNGDCVRTIYLTAGDSGGTKKYWISREDGVMAAYATALDIKTPHWYIAPYKLGEKTFVQVAHLTEANRKVSLLFLRLPDGGLYGQGYSSNNNETLARLHNGLLGKIHSVDGQSHYSKESLVDTLFSLMKQYSPAEIRIQTIDGSGNHHPDHGDHTYTAKLAMAAFERFRRLPAGSGTILSQYIGYPTYEKDQNVFGSDLEMKKKMFYTYGEHDRPVCQSDANCQHTAYEKYLPKQYKLP